MSTAANAAVLGLGSRYFDKLPRGLVERIAPKPGTGPSERAREKGHYTVETYTTTSSGARYRAKMAQRGDPGYKATSVLLGECALALAFDRDELSELRGVLTPAASPGRRLADAAACGRGDAGDLAAVLNQADPDVAASAAPRANACQPRSKRLLSQSATVQHPSDEGGHDMAGLDELFNEIPVQDIASKLGVPEGEVNTAIRTLVPALVGGLQHNVAADDIDSSKLEAAVTNQAASGLLDGGVSVDQVDQKEGDQIVANIFGGNDSNQVASALAGGGLANSGLLKKLLPILAPIVLAYIGKQLTKGNAAPGQHPGPGGAGRRRRPRRHPRQHPRWRSRRWRCCSGQQPARQHSRQRPRRPGRRRDR